MVLEGLVLCSLQKASNILARKCFDSCSVNSVNLLLDGSEIASPASASRSVTSTSKKESRPQFFLALTKKQTSKFPDLTRNWVSK